MYDLEQILEILITGCRNGKKYEKIVYNFLNDEKKPVAEKDKKLVTSLFEEAVHSYPNFQTTQDVLTLDFIQDITSGDCYLVDSVSKKMEEVNMTAIENAFNKKAFDFIKAKKLYSVFLGWNPDSKEFKYKENLVQSINLYRPADWQLPYFFKNQPVPATIMPKVYVDFFNHLVRNKESFDYLLSFTAATVQSGFRPQNYCVLTGVQGLGKGVYYQIMQELLGFDNAGYTPAASIIDSKFNAFAENKKLLFIDELEIKKPGDENILKPFVNDTIAIEAKGVDLIAVKNYASILLASNDIGKMKISREDRRFCFLDTGEKTLLTYVEELNCGHDIESYVKNILLDPVNISEFGKFLLNFKFDRKLLTSMLKSETRRTLQEETASDWVHAVMANLCPKHKGKKLILSEAQEKLKEITNSSIAPGRRQWVQLSKDIPGYFTVRVLKETNGEQNYYIDFSSEKEMPTYLKES
jgi:Family of unknown function (DUF5906)